jgi:hypothetical protein
MRAAALRELSRVCDATGRAGKVRAMQNADARAMSADRATKVFDAAVLVLPAVSAWIAFSQSAQAHALDALLGQGACGNLFMTPRAPVVLGHCFDCWSSGATAGAVALLLLMGARAAHEPWRQPT